MGRGGKNRETLHSEISPRGKVIVFYWISVNQGDSEVKMEKFGLV